MSKYQPSPHKIPLWIAIYQDFCKKNCTVYRYVHDHLSSAVALFDTENSLEGIPSETSVRRWFKKVDHSLQLSQDDQSALPPSRAVYSHTLYAAVCRVVFPSAKHDMSVPQIPSAAINRIRTSITNDDDVSAAVPSVITTTFSSAVASRQPPLFSELRPAAHSVSITRFIPAVASRKSQCWSEARPPMLSAAMFQSCNIAHQCGLMQPVSAKLLSSGDALIIPDSLLSPDMGIHTQAHAKKLTGDTGSPWRPPQGHSAPEGDVDSAISSMSLYSIIGLKLCLNNRTRAFADGGAL